MLTTACQCGGDANSDRNGKWEGLINYIDTVNADPKPFRWTKSPEDILTTIKRFCLRTLEIAQTQSESIRTSESAH